MTAPRRVGRPSCCPLEVLDRVVRLRAAGSRLVDICSTLNDDGVKTPGGGQRWWPSHVSRLLKALTALEVADKYDQRGQGRNGSAEDVTDLPEAL